MRTLVRCCTAAAVLTAGLVSASRADDKTPLTDATFVIKAASGGMLEVKLGEIAKQKAGSAEVKKLAEKIVEDHTKANKELKEIAAKNNLGLPTMLLPDDQKKLDKLSKLSGAEFDKEYVSCMDEDHKHDIKLFERAGKEVPNADLKAFATKTLPTLKEHEAMVKKCKENMTKGG